MIKKWIKAKKIELDLKLTFLQTVKKIVDEQKNIGELITKFYDALKDTPMEELQEKLITTFAEIIRDESNGN